MKDIICNCCFSGFLYKATNSQFDNPFFWNRITCKDFISLMANFQKIKFDNITIKLNKDIMHLDPIAIHKGNASIILKDFDIRVQMNHCVYDENFKTPTKIKVNDYVWDVHYVHIYNYIHDKFLLRQSRMNKETKKHFVFVDNARQFDTPNDFRKLFETADSYKLDLYFFTPDKSLKHDSPYVHIFYEPISFEVLTEKYKDYFEKLTTT